ncbi:MAG: hypothetical protein CVU81_00810, partial [Euryarchaeota archaeon HGW-Euryarchaeota-1]
VGGSDKSGFPMKKSVLGVQRKGLLLNKGSIGFTGHNERKGTQRRKLVVGDTVFEGTAQINCVVLKEGEKKFDEIFEATKQLAQTKQAETKK